MRRYFMQQCSLDAGGKTGTAAVFGDCPALLVDKSDHAVKSNIRTVHDHEHISQPDPFIMEPESDYRSSTVDLFEGLERKR